MRTAAALAAALLLAAPAAARATGAGSDTGPSVTVTPVVPIAPLPEPPTPIASAAPVATRAKGRWYGWQVMANDALSLLLAVDGGGTMPELPTGSYGLALGLLGGAVGAPLVHLMNGNPRMAGWSLLVRGGALAGTLLVANVDWDRDSGCSEHCVGGGVTETDLLLLGGAAVLAVGVINFMVTEYFKFARTPVPAGPRSAAIPAVSRPGGGGSDLDGAL